nr:MAG TPA: hypothetical protein [Caudoviricetes sp.]
MLGCNETFTRAGSADMYFVSRAKSLRVVQARTSAALNFRFTRHKSLQTQARILRQKRRPNGRRLGCK